MTVASRSSAIHCVHLTWHHDCGFQVISHPLCSPSTTTSTPTSKRNWLRVLSENEVIAAVDYCYQCQDTTFFHKGVVCDVWLHQCWNKCVKLEGDNVDK
eukprot:TRINITY_DN59392_c0_g1_i3.p1 TRINITY_DN59392_c0_g1~~TRINITY_DN59392_c0_g1_i3.p1  ORF type:complete len:115 (+),score=23.37 TRINITY_DN59392_c0_g1_i3:51-347(+)